MRHILVFSLSILSITGLSAAETTINDVRLAAGLSLDYTQEEDFTAFNHSGDADSDVLFLKASYVRSFSPLMEMGGLFWGLQVEYNDIESDSDLSALSSGLKSSNTTKMLGLGIQGGYAYVVPTMKQAHVELGLELSYYNGRQDRDLISPSPDDSYGNGLSGWGLNARLGGYYSFENGLQIGLDVIYVVERQLKGAQDSFTFGTINETQSGLLLGLSIGARL